MELTPKVMEITPKAWEIEIFLFISLIHKEEKGSPDKPGGLSIQLCKSEKKEFYIRYSS